MTLWIFLLLFLLFSPTLAQRSDVLELSDAELEEINQKCFSQAVESNLKGTLTSVLAKLAAPKGLYPFMAFLGRRHQFVCGAVFISPRHLLSVRECLVTDTGALATLSVYYGGECYGENITHCNGTVNMEEVAIDKIFFDKQESEADSRDLAIVQIKDLPSTLKPRIDFVCLPEKSSRFPSSGIVTGWGRMELAAPPKYLQHGPIGTIDNEHSFLGVIKYPTSILPRIDDAEGLKVFSNHGPDSSTGNAVLTYSPPSKRYVLQGLLLGSSWSSRFGRVVSDGVKIAPFQDDICHLLRLCSPSIDRSSVASMLELEAHKIPDGSTSDVPLNPKLLAIPYSVDVLCSGTSINVPGAFPNNASFEHIDTMAGTVDLYKGPDQNLTTTVLEFDIASTWDGPNANNGQEQINLHVCDPRKSSELATTKLSWMAFCWNTPYHGNDPINATQHSLPSKSYFSKCVNYNYGVAFEWTTENEKSILHVHWMYHAAGTPESLYGPCTEDRCCDIPLVHSPRFENTNYGDRYNGEYVENWNTAKKGNLTGLRLPMIKLDKGFNVDNIRLKVIFGDTHADPEPKKSPHVYLTGQYAYPCYYKWIPTEESTCVAGSNGSCTLKYTVDRSKVHNTKASNESTDISTEALTTEEADRIATSAVQSTVSETMTEAIEELDAELKNKVAAEIGGPIDIFTAKVSAEVSTRLAAKYSKSLSKKVTESFKNSNSQELKKTLQRKQELKKQVEDVHTNINEETVTASHTIVRTIKADPHVHQQLCQLSHVCYGRKIDTGIVNVFSSSTFRQFSSSPFEEK